MPFLFKWENAYDKHGNVVAEHDPNDPGGTTKYGIDQHSHPGVDVENLTREQALAIYKSDWDKWNIDAMPAGLGEVYFDAMENGGGDALLKQSGGDINRFLDLRADRFRSVAKSNPKLAGYLGGWLNRVEDLRRFVAPK
ncbi:MAG TPA: glycosyl hydrolase 108 family protein [Chthoniobacteraceae bacterium]|nr:glycosyl hydrolase 108 family protein [Chthoniobacteraceae bacterium]